MTVAVSVADWPVTEGLTEEVTAEVVPAWLIVCDRTVEVLVMKLVLPL